MLKVAPADLSDSMMAAAWCYFSPLLWLDLSHPHLLLPDYWQLPRTVVETELMVKLPALPRWEMEPLQIEKPEVVEAEEWVWSHSRAMA
jgi:hypothetical protein